MTTCGELRILRGDKSREVFAAELKVSLETLRRNESQMANLPVTAWLQKQLDKNIFGIAPPPPEVKKVFTEQRTTIGRQTEKLRQAIIKSYEGIK